MAFNIRGTIALDGEKEFRQAVTNSNSALTTLKSSVSLVDAQFKGEQNTLSALQAKHDALAKAVDASKQKEDALRAALDNAKSAQDKVGKGLDDLNKKYDQEKKKLDEMKSSGTASNAELKEQEKVVKDLGSAIDQGNQNYQTAENRINKWQTSLNKAEIETSNLSSELDETDGYLEEASESADECATSIDGYGKKVEGATEVTTSLGEKLKNAFTGNIVSAGIDLIKEGVQKLGEAFKSVVDTGSQFEAAMSQVEAISGATGSDLEALQAKAEEMGRATQYSATEAAEALQYMALAGWSTKEMCDGLEGVLNLAAASNMDLATASDIVTDYLSAFNMEASQSEELVDKMAFAMSNSNTDTEQLGEAYKNVAATATQLGYSCEDTTAALMAMADQGTKGGEAGTALSRIMTRLVNDTSGATEAMEALAGVDVIDKETGELNDLSDVLVAAQEGWAGLTDEAKGTMSYTIAGASAQTEFMEIMGASEGVLEEYASGLENCDGCAAAMADTMQDNFVGATGRLNSAVEGLQDKLFGFVEGPLTTLADGAANVVNAITDSLGTESTELDNFLNDTHDAVDGVREALENLKEGLASVTDDSSSMEGYKAILTDLNSQEELTEYQKYELKNVVDELAGSVPGLADAFDEESGTLNLTNEELERMLDHADAVSGMNTLTGELEQAQLGLSDAQKAEAEAASAEEEAQKRYDEVITDSAEQTGWYTKEQREAADALEQAKKDHQDASDAVDEYEDIIEDTKERLDEYEDKVEETTAAVEDQDGALEGVEMTWQQVADAVGASAETEAEACQHVRDAYNDMVESISSDIANDVIDLGKKFEIGDTVTVDEMNADLDSQIQAMEDYVNNMETIVSVVGDKISPEFLQYLQDMGMDGAGYIQSMCDELAADEEAGIEKIAETSDKWVHAMDLDEGLSQMLASSKIAYEQGLGELGSTEAEFTGLRESIDKAIDESADQWTGLNDATREALDNVIDTAQQCGIQIPDGLASAIQSGEKGPDDAIEDIQGAIQGHFLELTKIAEENGIEIPAELQAGIDAGGDSAVQAMQDLCTLMVQSGGEIPDEMYDKGSEAGQSYAEGEESAVGAVESSSGALSDAASDGLNDVEVDTNAGEQMAEGISSSEGEVRSAAEGVSTAASEGLTGDTSGAMAAGEELGQSFAEGISSTEGNATAAAETIATAAAQAAQALQGEYEAAGSTLGQSVASGITSQSGSCLSAGQSVAQAAISGARGQTGSASSVGSAISSGIASGIRSGQSSAINAAINVAKAALRAAKKELGIKSPSKKFKDEVGKMIGDGMAEGINESSKTAQKSAESMSNAVFKEATSWLKKYQKSHETSVEDEKWYWKQIMGECEEGTKGYTKALTKYSNDVAKIIDSSVSRTKTTGSGDNKKEEKKSKSEVYSDIYDAAKDYMDKLEIRQDVSQDESLAYWTAIQKHLKKGSDAWYDAQKQINSITDSYQKNIVDAADTTMSHMKIMNDVSLDEQIQYWKDVRSQLKKYSDEWYDVTEKIHDLQSDQVSELEKDIEHQQIIGEVSLADQIAYWKDLRKELDKYSDDWYDVTKKIQDLKAEQKEESANAASDLVDQAEKTLEHIQTLNSMTTETEIKYWENVKSELTPYTDEWYEVTQKINSLKEGTNSSILSDAQDTLSRVKVLNDVSLDAEIEYWEDVRKELDKYSDDWYTVTETINDLKNSYYDEMVSAAEDYADQMATIDGWSVQEELAYWEQVQKSVEKGTDAWYSAQKQINSIKSKIGTVSNMSSLLSAYTTYYDLSEKAEMQYWDTIRKQYEEGTDERLAADQYYFDAKEKYTQKLEDLEDDYLDKVKSVDDQLESDIKSLTDKYESELDSLVSSYKSAFNIFDEFMSESATGQELLFNIQSQAAGYEAWSDALDELADRGILSDELLEELTDQGPDQLAAIYALSDLTDEELTEYQEAFDRKMTAIQTQAEKDTADTLAEVEAQTAELTAQAEKDKQDLLDEYNADLASVNETISSELKTLADNATSIADDQTTALVSAIDGGVSSITKALDDYQKAASEASKTASTVTSGATSSGNITTSAGITAADKTSGSSSSSSAEKTDAVLSAIYSGPVVTTLTAAERKKHNDLYLFLVDNYGHGGNNKVYSALADALNVTLKGKTATADEKSTILKKLKKKGYGSYARGGRIDDVLAWIDEELEDVGPEMIVRKSDNAILTRTKPGDEVIDATTTANLVRLSKIDPDELMDVMAKQQTAIMSTLSQLNAIGSAQINDLAATDTAQIVPVSPDLSGMESRMDAVESMLAECVGYLSDGQNLYIDTDKLVGGTSEKMGIALAKKANRAR